MCGIAGYIGKNQASYFLLDALKRLEYRGYDSAGMVALSKNNTIECVKSVGKIDAFEKKLKGKKLEGCVGISHTRWATHGYPSENNTHPHSDSRDNIWLVHNGIIENYRTLKEELIREGHSFKSETDTEVISHLIEHYFENNLEKAVLKALERIEGAYALTIIAKDDPDKIVVAKKSSPLVIGIGKDEYFVASDPSAIAGYTDKIIYFDDNELGIIKEDDY